MIKFIKKFIRVLYINFIYKPTRIAYLFRDKTLYRGNSYYPEAPIHKTVLEVVSEQLMQILKYGKENVFYFPYGFDVKSKSEMESYIHYLPFMELREFYNEKGKKDPSFILRNKFMFSIFVESMGYKACSNIALLDQYRCFDMKTKTYYDPIQYIESLDGAFFLKPLDGECGNGILKFEVSNGYLLFNNQQVSAQSLLEKVASSKYLLQEAISQHQLLSNLHPTSINTIRLITIKSVSTNCVEVFPSILRIGTSGSVVDNTSQGGLAVGIDMNGQLLEYGYYKPEYGCKVDCHPDTNIKFQLYNIPYFNEAIKQAKDLHSMLPGIGSIGWDIAISEDGPIFIEGNDNWEINGPQICHGGLKDKLVTLFA